MEVQSGKISDEMESGGNGEREEEGSLALDWGGRTIMGPLTVRRTGRCWESEKMVSVRFEHDALGSGSFLSPPKNTDITTPLGGPIPAQVVEC